MTVRAGARETDVRGPGLLAGYRVLELPGEPAAFAGRVFADLGAAVTKVEPVEGDPLRETPPFAVGGDGPAASLSWEWFAAGKRSITLDLEQPAGRRLLDPLVRASDVVLSAYRPRELTALGLNRATIPEVWPGVVFVSVTPFGLDGPKADWPASDLTLWAASGYLYLTGDTDRPPVRVSFPPQACLHGSLMAVAGALIALQHRAATGRGQVVDVSLQQALAWLTVHAPFIWDVQRENIARAGYWRRFGRTWVRSVFPCRDGYVVWMLMGGRPGRANRRLVAWMAEEGMAPEWLQSLDWESLNGVEASQEQIEQIADVFAAFFATKTKRELFERAIREQCMIAPVHTIADLLADEQLDARRFWRNGSATGVDRFPGPALRFSGDPMQARAVAPGLGQDNALVYLDELGLSDGDLAALAAQGAV